MHTTSTMALPSSILAGILLSSIPRLTSAQTDNGDECSCFRTNGSSKGYFAYHRFFDYRNVANASANPPTVISNTDNATNAYATSNFFLTNAWTNDWTVQNWNNSDSIQATDASILMVNSPNNVYIGPYFSSPSQVPIADHPQIKAATVHPTTPPTSLYAPLAFPTSNPLPKSIQTRRISNTSQPASSLE
jgi:hypothetical protein